MNTILNFNDFTNEGLINKTLKRVRTGEKRTEDKYLKATDALTKFCRDFLAYDFNVDYSENLCTFELTPSPKRNYNCYKLSLNYPLINDELDVIELKIYIHKDYGDSDMLLFTFELSKELSDFLRKNTYKVSKYHLSKLMTLLQGCYRNVRSDYQYVPDFYDFAGMCEGFMNKTLKRIRTGEEREENKEQTNIAEMKPVDICEDFPFEFADIDLSAVRWYTDEDDFVEFTFDEVEKFDQLGNKHGWRVPWSEDIEKIDEIINDKYKTMGARDFAEYINNIYRNFVEINIDNPEWDDYLPFWCSDMAADDDYVSDEEAYYWYVMDSGRHHYMHLKTRNTERNHHIRFIRDKKKE